MKKISCLNWFLVSARRIQIQIRFLKFWCAGSGSGRKWTGFATLLSILHSKLSALPVYLALEALASSQVKNSMFTSRSSAYFWKQKTLKARSTHPARTTRQLNKHSTWKVLCTVKSTHATFQVFCTSNTTWQDASTKGKCAGNAENFHCNLLTVPLINLILMDCQTILKERACKQWIAT